MLNRLDRLFFKGFQTILVQMCGYFTNEYEDIIYTTNSEKGTMCNVIMYCVTNTIRTGSLLSTMTVLRKRGYFTLSFDEFLPKLWMKMTLKAMVSWCLSTRLVFINPTEFWSRSQF